MAETYDRTFALEDIEISRASGGRTVTAYAAVFDQDAEISDQHGRYVERIDRRAFNRIIGMKQFDRIGVLFNHGYDTTGRPNMLGSVPIGTPLEIKADGRGLLTVTRYNQSAMADGVLEAIRDGQIKGQSFRGRIVNSADTTREGRRFITRTELGLREYGPTPTPAYEGAGILAIRSQDDLREMIRDMIRTESGTPDGSADLTKVTPGPGLDPEDPPERHSRKQAQYAMRMRRLGVKNAEAS